MNKLVNFLKNEVNLLIVKWIGLRIFPLMYVDMRIYPHTQHPN